MAKSKCKIHGAFKSASRAEKKAARVGGKVVSRIVKGVRRFVVKVVR